MMTTKSLLTVTAAVTSVVSSFVTLAAPTLALAKSSSIADQPAVRHKIELRKGRFELAPTFETSIALDYKNIYSGGLRAEYHLNDWLSVGGMGFFGASVNSGLTNQIIESLPMTSPDTDPTPAKSDFETHLNDMKGRGAVFATLTPWAGKLALFGKSYLNFDLYFRGGVSFAQLSNKWDGAAGRTIDSNMPECSDASNAPQSCFLNPKNDGPQNDGTKPGFLVGGGLHVFINNWMAVDLSIHNYMFTDNPSGLDFDGDKDVDGADKRFLSHLFFGVGLSMYLPGKANVSR